MVMELWISSQRLNRNLEIQFSVRVNALAHDASTAVLQDGGSTSSKAWHRSGGCWTRHALCGSWCPTWPGLLAQASLLRPDNLRDLNLTPAIFCTGLLNVYVPSPGMGAFYLCAYLPATCRGYE